MHRRRGYRQLVEADLDIMPLMNLFVVLIPMLLLSAVFVEMSAIDMDLPGERTEAGDGSEGLGLSVRLESDRYVVRGRSLAARVIDRDQRGAETRLLETLRAIRELHPDESSLRIESPDAARYQEIVTVMDISRDAGLGAISLAAATTHETRDAR